MEPHLGLNMRGRRTNRCKCLYHVHYTYYRQKKSALIKREIIHCRFILLFDAQSDAKYISRKNCFDDLINASLCHTCCQCFIFMEMNLYSARICPRLLIAKIDYRASTRPIFFRRDIASILLFVCKSIICSFSNITLISREQPPRREIMQSLIRLEKAHPNASWD